MRFSESRVPNPIVRKACGRPFKSKYGHWCVKCPLCGEQRGVRAIVSHIGLVAAWERRKLTAGKIKETPHFDFWIKNTEPNPKAPRVWKTE